MRYLNCAICKLTVTATHRYSEQEVVRALEHVEDAGNINQIIEYIHSDEERHLLREQKAIEISEMHDDDEDEDEAKAEEMYAAPDAQGTLSTTPITPGPGPTDDGGVNLDFLTAKANTKLKRGRSDDSHSEMYGMDADADATPRMTVVVETETETKTGGEQDDDLPPSPQRHDSEHSDAIFGAPPLLLASTMCAHKDYGAPIPNVLSTLKEALWAHEGHLTPGIFREAGDAAQVSALVRRLNHGELYSIDFGEVAAHALASLVKLWFASLPQRVLDDVDAAQLNGCKNMKVAGAIVEAEMGEPFKSFFKWMLDVCLGVFALFALFAPPTLLL